MDYLKTGRATRTAAFGPMAEVVGNSTQYMSRPDLFAIATYLKGVGGEAGAPAASGGAVKGVVPSRGYDASTTALRSGDVAKRGSLIYLNNCGGCHRSDGQGSQRTFPALGLSSAVVAKDPTSLIRIVLQGSAMPHTVEAPSALAMPGFGWRLGDNDVADVLTFVRSSWGNSSEPVGAKSVAKVRSEIAKSVASK